MAKLSRYDFLKESGTSLFRPPSGPGASVSGLLNPAMLKIESFSAPFSGVSYPETSRTAIGLTITPTAGALPPLHACNFGKREIYG